VSDLDALSQTFSQKHEGVSSYFEVVPKALTLTLANGRGQPAWPLPCAKLSCKLPTLNYP